MKTHVRILLQSAGLHLPAIDNEDNLHLVGWFVGLSLALWFSVGWAFVATFYTINEITHNRTQAILVGIIVACFIYIAERAILNTPKTGKFLADVKSIIPRILITAVINLAFSHSVMIMLFEKRLQPEMQKMALENKIDCEKDIDNQVNELNSKITTLDNQVAARRNTIYASDAQMNELKENIKIKEGDIQAKEAQVSNNNTIIGQNTGQERRFDRNLEREIIFDVPNETAKTKRNENYGLNRNIRSLKKEISDLEKEIDGRKEALKPQTDALESSSNAQRQQHLQEIQRLTSGKDEAVTACIKEKMAAVDFWTKDEAMDRIKQKPGMSMKAFIALFILWCLDTSVLLMKLFGRKNGYDEYMLTRDLLAKLKYSSIYAQTKETFDNEMAELKQKLEQNKNLNVTINREKLEAELSASRELTMMAGARATDLAKKIVEDWYQEQMLNIERPNMN